MRLNHKLVSFEIFSGIIFLMDAVLFKIQTYALNPEECELGRNFRLQNGLNLFRIV